LPSRLVLKAILDRSAAASSALEYGFRPTPCPVQPAEERFRLSHSQGLLLRVRIQHRVCAPQHRFGLGISRERQQAFAEAQLGVGGAPVIGPQVLPRLTRGCFQQRESFG
jgi:hypothetical protein